MWRRRRRTCLDRSCQGVWEGGTAVLHVEAPFDVGGKLLLALDGSVRFGRPRISVLYEER